MRRSIMPDISFKYPIPCKIVGHSFIPEGWPGEVVGLCDLANEIGFGLSVRFEDLPETLSLHRLWAIDVDHVETGDLNE